MATSLALVAGQLPKKWPCCVLAPTKWTQFSLLFAKFSEEKKQEKKEGREPCHLGQHAIRTRLFCPSDNRSIFNHSTPQSGPSDRASVKLAFCRHVVMPLVYYGFTWRSSQWISKPTAHHFICWTISLLMDSFEVSIALQYHFTWHLSVLWLFIFLSLKKNNPPSPRPPTDALTDGSDLITHGPRTASCVRIEFTRSMREYFLLPPPNRWRPSVRIL